MMKYLARAGLGAVGEGFLFHEAVEDAQENIENLGFAVVMPMAGRCFTPMLAPPAVVGRFSGRCGAGTGAVKHDGVVEHVALLSL